MKQTNARRPSRSGTRSTGADGVSVLPAAMTAALITAGIAITRSVRRSRAAAAEARVAGNRARVAETVQQDAPSQRGETSGGTDDPGSDAFGPEVPSGQAAVRATVDDDGR